MRKRLSQIPDLEVWNILPHFSLFPLMASSQSATNRRAGCQLHYTSLNLNGEPAMGGNEISPVQVSQGEQRFLQALRNQLHPLVTDTARGLGMGPATTEGRLENCFMYKSIRSGSSVHHCPTVPQSGAEYQPPQAVLSPGLPRGLVLGHTDSRCDPLPPQSF